MSRGEEYLRDTIKGQAGQIQTLEALLIEVCERLSKSLTDKTPEGFYDNELKISMLLSKPEIKKLLEGIE